MKQAWMFALLLMAAGCTGPAGRTAPAALDTEHDACGSCRMSVSSARFAAQIVAPGEEPVFFDDIGCLARYIRDRPQLPPAAVAYVADHRTSEWAPAATAVFTRAPSIDTPMASHIVAHASEESRSLDASALAGAGVAASEIFNRPLPDGSR